MSGMANEMEARLREDGGQGLIHTDPASGAGPAPGNEGGQPPPAAEPSTTDTSGQGGTPPETIPYSRFKEVNDKYSDLKGYEQLKSFGYDPDSLGRLAAFEAQYQADPYGTLKTMAERLDLPQELVDRIADPTAGGGDRGGGPGPSADANGNGNPAPQELPPDVKERLDYVDTLRERDAQASRDALLARVEAEWDKLDTVDGIETPKMMKLMAIRTLADGPQTFTTIEDFAKAARAPIVDYRSTTLGSAVQNRPRGMAPALPGGGPAPAEAVDFGSDIKAASKAAQAAIERGELPT